MISSGLMAKMEAQVERLCFLHNQKKDNNQFKNEKQPDLPENRTVWKSDKQEVKEETFIQTGRRDGDGQPGQEDQWQGSRLCR